MRTPIGARVSGLRLLLAAALLVAAASPLLRGDEGMWTFDNPPVKQLEAKYHFTPTQAWLDHVRLASVRIDDVASGAFVSPNGLLLTNQHVTRMQLQGISSAEHEYLRDGFYAATRDQEMKFPDLEVDVLVGMKDVTARIEKATKGAAGEAQGLKAREAERAAIAKESKDATGLRSDLVSLYNGSEYWLYQYKVYTDVRLVFAAEEQAAFYGGDPDNFTYPRYDLDMAFFRVYDNGAPLHTENYLKWNSKGAATGELVFVSGDPVSTKRQETVADLLTERDAVEPAYIAYFKQSLDAAQALAQQGADQARLVASTITFLQNDLKDMVGEHDALLDKGVLAKKQAEESELRARIAARPEWQKEYGGAWDAIARVEEQARPEMTRRILRNSGSQLFYMALEIVEYAAEVKKPDGERMAGFNEAALEPLRAALLSPAQVSPLTEKAFMVSSLKLMQEKLGAQDAYLQAITQGGDIDKVANALVDGTRMGDAAFRKSLLDGGEAAVAASTDPMIAAVRRVDPVVRANYALMRDSVRSVLTPAEEKVGKARFLVYGKDAYPDANATPRLSYGTIESYAYNGTVAAPFTTFYGLYDRAAGFGNQPPFDLSAKEAAALGKVNLATPLNFVCSDDTVGGNSGSPVINRGGELVGLIFDGNIESLAGDFVFDAAKNRAVALHTAAMIEALRKIYAANALADELEGKK